MNPDDPCSFSNAREAAVTSVHLRLTVDFEARRLHGAVELRVERREPSAAVLMLDTRDLDITAARRQEDGAALQWTLEKERTHRAYGTPLRVQLPPADAEPLTVVVEYATRPESTALAWLEPAQTAGKKEPYVYSHCEAIHCRSMAPLQDTPAVKTPFTAELTVPARLTALMSGLREGREELADGTARCRFRQPVPVPSYLITLAVGNLESRPLGPRSSVWSEPEVVDKAANEFVDTEKMLKAAEEICGPYIWGVYDLLVLPPSFPFGGTENPCLTFITPTVIAGDRSLVDVVAHEIAHSWTGNLVTNRSWEHFWLNEGFTMFLERKILARLHGEPARHFSAAGGWKCLRETIRTRGADDPLTCLSPRLTDVDPDDAFSTVPYEKGHPFLWYLEQLAGGDNAFDPFLRAYVEKFRLKSIDSSDFRSFLEGYAPTAGAFDKVDWEAWLHTPGMPPVEPKFDSQLADVCSALTKRWLDWDCSNPCPFTSEDLTALTSGQVVELLAQLLEAPPLPVTKLEKMQELYDLDSRANSEIRFRWLRVGLAARWEHQLQPALEFVTEQGRMKFIRPIYRDLYSWEEARSKAIATYERNKPNMMHVAIYTVAKDLHLSE